MYAEERHQTILDEARKIGRVDVAGLATRFQITTETVRRDLTLLEGRGLLHRVHGGAIPVTAGSTETNLPAREAVMLAEKRRIARAALALVPEQGAILLDVGTTAAELAQLIPVDRELTVVTNAIDAAVHLTGKGNLTVMLVGGRIRPRSLVAVDNWALRLLSETYVDVAFLAPDGISLERGLTSCDHSEAMVKRAAMSAARRTVVLADHTKIGHDQFARFGDLAGVDTLITDERVDGRAAAEIRRAGPRVLTV
jgi:DeoR family fructose operon transcriptional repressor